MKELQRGESWPAHQCRSLINRVSICWTLDLYNWERHDGDVLDFRGGKFSSEYTSNYWLRCWQESPTFV